jgi:hypothetical protein
VLLAEIEREHRAAGIGDRRRGLEHGLARLIAPARAAVGAPAGRGIAGRNGHEGRPDDSIAELVATPDDVDDLALRAPAAGHVRDRLVLARVERRAGDGLDRGDALAVEEGPQLAVDRRHALDPAVVGQVGRTVVDREVEVVGDHEHLADEVLAREPEHLLALLGRPAPVVAELGALALQPGEILVGPHRRYLIGPQRTDRQRMVQGFAPLVVERQVNGTIWDRLEAVNKGKEWRGVAIRIDVKSRFRHRRLQNLAGVLGIVEYPLSRMHEAAEIRTVVVNYHRGVSEDQVTDGEELDLSATNEVAVRREATLGQLVTYLNTIGPSFVDELNRPANHPTVGGPQRDHGIHLRDTAFNHPIPEKTEARRHAGTMRYRKNSRGTKSRFAKRCSLGRRHCLLDDLRVANHVLVFSIPEHRMRPPPIPARF